MQNTRDASEYRHAICIAKRFGIKGFTINVMCRYCDCMNGKVGNVDTNSTIACRKRALEHERHSFEDCAGEWCRKGKTEKENEREKEREGN